MIKPKGIPGERCSCSPWEKIKEQIQALYDRCTQLGQRDNELEDEIDGLDDRVTDLEQEGSITVDDELSLSSENPVQNKVITEALNGKEPAAIRKFAAVQLRSDDPYGEAEMTINGLDASKHYDFEIEELARPNEPSKWGCLDSFGVPNTVFGFFYIPFTFDPSKVPLVDEDGSTTIYFQITCRENAGTANVVVASLDRPERLQVQSNWNEADTGSPAYIQNKPTIPDAPVQSDWNESDNTSLAYIQNKPTIPAAVTVDSTWIQNSTNPAESQLIQTALSGKADMSAGAGAPTTSTVGAVGEFYFDTTNNELYQCTGNSGTEPLTYSWQKVGGSGGEDYWMYNYGTSKLYHNGQEVTKEALVQELIDNQIPSSYHATAKPIRLIYLGWFYQGPFIADLGAWSVWSDNGTNVLRSTTCFTDNKTSRFIQILYTNTNGTINNVNITVESYNISPLSVTNTSVSGTHAAGTYQDLYISADAALMRLPAELVTPYLNGAITITHRTDNVFYVRINFVEALTLESSVTIKTLLIDSSGSGGARLTIYDNYGDLLLPPASGGSSFTPSTGDIFSTIAGRLSTANVMASSGFINMGYMQSDGTITALTSGTPVSITDTILGSSVTFTLTPTVFTPDSPSGIYNEGRVAITYNSITRYYSVTNGAWYME